MWKKDRQKKGFTLVEILVVISIVAIMSVFAVGGYTSYRQSALLDLAVDDLVSQISEAYEKTVKGFGLVKDEASRCYGLYFLKAGEDYEVMSFWQEYKGKKIWVNEAWEFAGCGNFSEENSVPITMDKAANVEAIFLGGVPVVSDFIVRFVPPEGRVEVGESRFGLAQSDSKMKVVIRFGEGAKSKTQSFVYDLKSLITSDE